MAVHSLDGCARSEPRARPRYDLGEIFRTHSESFRARHRLSPEQARVMRAIEACRTAALGGHLDLCLDCGLEVPAYNSCRNRHCPKCQALDQHRWLEQRRQRILPVPYFHVVFTLPGELAAIGLRNRRRIYDLLFAAASATLLELGRDPQRLGGQLGVTMVLHTWTRDLRFHPHVHAVVTGGGLSADGRRWIEGNEKYLFPVKVMGRLFRGKFLASLADARRGGDLELPQDRVATFDDLVSRLYAKDWVVYAKRPFAGPEQVFAYLGRYTHRVAISNYRILDVQGEDVTIATRHGESVSLTADELIRRFLLHVLPQRFVRIRHYGLMASINVRTRLEIARALLDPGDQQQTPESPDGTEPAADAPQPSSELFPLGPRRCRACGSPNLLRVPIAAATRCRAPPLETAAA